ncbi:MAG: hypothetical protein GX848_03460 [Clostridiales bacterium]|jgi:hypothetical protein|nr:hypothetical protein [Clostridiales bacterium]
MRNNAFFAPDAYLASLYKKRLATPFAQVNTAEQAQAACDGVRKSLRDLLALNIIDGQCAALEPTTLKTAKRKGYTEKRLILKICDDWNMLLYLLIPETPNAAGVVALSGHGYGARQTLRLDRRGNYRIFNFFDNYQKNFAAVLAQQGCTVAIPELIAFGEARLQKDRHKPFYNSSCYAVTSALHLCGTSTAALRVYQAVRCLDFLEKQASVDPLRLGCMGISGGGLISLLTACIDERVSRAVVSGYISTFETSILARWHCADNYIHGLLGVGEPADIAAAIAPRKLSIESGRRDPLFPIDGAAEAHANIQRIYECLGAKDNLIIDVFNGRHQISGKKSFRFFSE